LIPSSEVGTTRDATRSLDCRLTDRRLVSAKDSTPSPIRACVNRQNASVLNFSSLSFSWAAKSLLYRPHSIPSFRSPDSARFLAKRCVQSPIRFWRQIGGSSFLFPLLDTRAQLRFPNPANVQCGAVFIQFSRIVPPGPQGRAQSNTKQLELLNLFPKDFAQLGRAVRTALGRMRRRACAGVCRCHVQVCRCQCAVLTF
jgi:hypothetical protein